jgi:crossover junction endodeoxyribonuclease RuvC
VLLAVARRFPDYDVRNNNEADALVLAAMGFDHLGQPLVQMPAPHRAALAAAQWPNHSEGISA